MFKKFAPVLALALPLAFAVPAQAAKLSVAATPVPHAELLEFVKPDLAKEGVDLDIKVFTDYVQPNLQVSDKQIDAKLVDKAIKDLGIDPEKKNPAIS